MLHDHVPSMGEFRKTALISILVTLVSTVVLFLVWPETGAVVVPLLLTCALLVQERLTLGRYRAWITNQRVILQGGQDAPLWDVTSITPRWAGARLDGVDMRLTYVADIQALRDVIVTAQQRVDV